MKSIVPQEKCTGCGACFSICTRGAIAMCADAEDFLYPRINKTLCVDCGLCQRTCPSLHPYSSREPLDVYAVNAKDDGIRMCSSSGGVFTLLATATIEKQGLVFGAVFDSNDWQVYHWGTDNKSGVARLGGSKYVQSEMRDSYNRVYEAVKKGRYVLFSGTPCQVAGLKHYFGVKPYVDVNKLLLVDIVCHAVPSPLAWRKYLENRVSSIYNGQTRELGKIKRISCRCKNNGWKRYSMSLSFVNGKEYKSVSREDPFMRGFLAELYNRPSCHDCPCRNLKSGSDLTIADYWGVASRFPDMDDDKGTSLVLINSERGQSAIDSIASNIVIRRSEFAHACETNSAIIRSKAAHENRGKFFKRIMVDEFDSVVHRLLAPSIFRRIRYRLGMVKNATLRKIGTA